MIVELPNFKNGFYKTAKCLKFLIPREHSIDSKSDVWLFAEWDTPPTGYGSRFRVIAEASSKHELQIWWDMQNESIPLAGKVANLLES